MKILNTNKKEQVVRTMRKALQNFIGQLDDEDKQNLSKMKEQVSNWNSDEEIVSWNSFPDPTAKIYYCPENQSEDLNKKQTLYVKSFNKEEILNLNGLFIKNPILKPIEHLDIMTIKCPIIKIYQLQDNDIQNFVEDSDNWNFMTLGPPISNKD